MQGGSLDLEQLRYVVAPVAARMAELEGPKLGGFYTDVIVNWLSGIPLSRVKTRAQYDDTMENLISI
jgi:hypothetical protein